MDSQPFPNVEPGQNCYGQLIVQVTTAQGAIPLEGAQVDVRSYEPEDVEDPESYGNVIASLVSGRDGNTPPIRLSSPPCSFADGPGGEKPYRLYQAEVFLEGYYNQNYIGIPIYEGITVIQPAVMIPLPENGSVDTPNDTRYFESEEPEL